MTFNRTSASHTPRPAFGQRPNIYSNAYRVLDDVSMAEARVNGDSNDTGRPRRTGLWFGVGLISISAMTFATAQSQSASPFARKKAKQAWETQAPAQNPIQAPPQSGDAFMSNSTSSTSFEPYANQPVQNQNSPYEAYGQPASPQTSGADIYGMQGTYTPPQQSAPQTGLATYSSSQIDNVNSGSGTYYPGRSSAGSKPAPQSANTQFGSQAQYAPQGQNAPQGNANAGSYGSYGGAPSQNRGYPQQQKRSWLDKFGLGNLATSVSGFLKGGAAATKRASDDASVDTGWNEDFVLDAALRGEVSAITQSGLEYGIGAEVRGQYDQYRRGFGGRVGDCPAGIAGCPTTTANGITRAVRGHTSRFYTDGPDEAEDFEVALEGAYVFLRTSYGDLTVGRDDGSAYLFSLGAPKLLSVGASNNSVDYTGLDSVKTVNDASGFSEKIAYVTPRLLGDQIGVGVQLGVSYALDATACGVDYCVKSPETDGTGTLSPDLKNVIEAGIALDRNFGNGFSVEATGTYARANERSGFAAFDNLQAYGLGLDLGYHDWKVGGSYLKSNNGLSDGDYTAYDVGLTWEPGPLGFTIGYGHAEDKNVNLTSNQGIFGMNYDFGKFRLGSGVQYVERKVPVNTGGTITRQNEKATSVFIEGGFTF